MPNLEAHRRQKNLGRDAWVPVAAVAIQRPLALSIQLAVSPDPLPEDARRDPVGCRGGNRCAASASLAVDRPN
jgi:hypothetical protein